MQYGDKRHLSTQELVQHNDVFNGFNAFKFFCWFETGEALKLDIPSCYAGLLGTAISTGTSTLTASRGNTSKMDIEAVQNF